jgi:hypothetical protein
VLRVLASDVTRVSSAGLVVFHRASVNTISRDSHCSLRRVTNSYVVRDGIIPIDIYFTAKGG